MRAFENSDTREKNFLIRRGRVYEKNFKNNYFFLKACFKQSKIINVPSN